MPLVVVTCRTGNQTDKTTAAHAVQLQQQQTADICPAMPCNAVQCSELRRQDCYVSHVSHVRVTMLAPAQAQHNAQHMLQHLAYPCNTKQCKQCNAHVQGTDPSPGVSPGIHQPQSCWGGGHHQLTLHAPGSSLLDVLLGLLLLLADLAAQTT